MTLSLVQKLQSLIKLAAVVTPGSDGFAMPKHQIQYKGKLGESVPWFPFGFHAVPTPDSFTLVVSPNARPEERVDFPSSAQDRIPVAVGEVIVYHPATKSKMHFKADGTIDIASDVQVNVTAPLTQVNGDLDVTGTFGVAGTAQFQSNVEIDANLTVDLQSTLTGDVSFGGATNVTNSNGVVDLTEHRHTRGGTQGTIPEN